ncbi:trypsin-like peptidase domain-containing protein [Thermopirellula anaerolimosa]
MHERACGHRSLPSRGAVIVILAIFHPWLVQAVASPPHPLAGQTVLLDFYASWCGPCREMVPTVTELERQGYPVRRIDVDRERELAQLFGVHSLPTFIMLVDGQEAGRLIGGQSLSALAELCRRAPRPAPSVAPSAPTPTPPRQAAPTGATEAGNVLLTNTRTGVGTGKLPGLMEGVRYASTAQADLTAVTVRIRIADETGRSTGSGTIIDARGGEALILTCGHLFRESKGKAPIRVDLFGPQPVSDLPAELLDYDERLDLGLITIRPPFPVVAARVAPPGFPLSQGDPIFTVGCNGGDPPTVRQGKITALNRYLGPANIEASGAPVTGRSGGGLFSAEGFLIGVCNAADPQLDEGIYAALKEIHGRLDRMELSFVYRNLPVEDVAVPTPPLGRSPGVAAVSAVRGDVSTVIGVAPRETTGDNDVPSNPVGRTAVAAGDQAAAPDSVSTAFGRDHAATLTAQSGMPLPIPVDDPPLQPVRGPERSNDRGATAMLTPPSRNPGISWNNVALTRESMPNRSAVAQPERPSATPVGSEGLTAEERAALEEIARRRAQGYEIVCVVRPTDNTNSPSEVIVLRDASPAFLAALQRTTATAPAPAPRVAGPTTPTRGSAAVSSSSAVATTGTPAATRAPGVTAVLPAVVLPGPVR